MPNRETIKGFPQDIHDKSKIPTPNLLNIKDLHDASNKKQRLIWDSIF